MLIPNPFKGSCAYPEPIQGFLCLSQTYQGEGCEGFQRAISKPFGRLCRGEILLQSPPMIKRICIKYSAYSEFKNDACSTPIKGGGCEGFQRAIAKPFGRLRRGEILCPIQGQDERNRIIRDSAHRQLFPAARFHSFCGSPPSLMAMKYPSAKVTRLTRITGHAAPDMSVPIRMVTGEATTRPKMAQ